ncbi:OPT/YSL family transporter [bacterium]|nr:OPT/YSL family transporter [bacterium]MBU1983729.1 OPT/YSL family transporter [bacterium]
MSDPKPKTPEQLEREWFKNVYRGDDMPQLTLRAVIMGSFLGAFMSLSNLYIGLKTGWGLGVAITACILSFTIWKSLRKIMPRWFKTDMSILENNAMQSTASSAGYSTGGTIVSAIAAYLLVNGVHIGYGLLTAWVFFLAVLGVTMAIPMKRQMINIEQLKFPSGIAAAETLKSLHGDKAEEGTGAAKALFAWGAFGIIIATVRDWFALIPQLYSWFGSRLAMYTISFEASAILVAAGAIMGLKVCVSLMIGGVLNWGVLAPAMIQQKVIEHPAPHIQSKQVLEFPLTIPAGNSLELVLTEATMGPRIEQGAETQRMRYVWPETQTYASMAALTTELNTPTLPGGEPNPFHGKLEFGEPQQAYLKNRLEISAPKAIHYQAILELPENVNGAGSACAVLALEPGSADDQQPGGYRNIVSWSLWGGAACMVTSGLLSFALQWQTVLRAFSGLRRVFSRKKKAIDDPLERVEVPGSWFASGMLVGTIGVVAIAAIFFNIPVWMGLLAVFLSFFLALVACRACGETDTTPVGAMGKITQLIYGAIAPRQMNTNLMTACITAGVADSASDLLTDLKSGYVLGANARRQFLAQFSGIFIGTIVVVPAFYLIVPDVSVLGSDKFPAPAAQVWASVALLLSHGFASLHPTARIALIIGGLVGILIPALERLLPKYRKFMPSAMGLGLSFVIPFYNVFSMFLGGVIAAVFMKVRPVLGEKFIIPSASGVIAGESLMGIFITLMGALGWIA